ncbi:MAG: recombinase family protein [Bacillota bacterium]
MPRITTIPATKNKFTALPTASIAKRRTAGYARVSTDSDEQFTSYEAQIDYYTKLITAREDWEFVDVYTDEGISALNTKHRDGFNRMIQDAINGEIDLIVTKSVSRFARNTVDSLVTIRKLKEKGVECYFEKENIFTFDGKGELLLTIMSSLAQEESRSISENVTWGQRKRFSDGKVSVGYSQFLGFEKGEDGNLKVVPEQAETVRLIYKLFLEGKTTQGIANFLMEHDILSPAGKQTWRSSTISSILSNEKYKGDALLQKRFTADFLTKELRVNNGEVPQYYVEGSHKAIIAPEEFQAVQEELARRKELGRAYSDKAFHSKIICGDCGGFYGRKVWHSTDEYKSVIFQCNRKFNNSDRCRTPKLTEEEIKKRFLAAYNELMGSRETVLADCELIRQALCDTSALETEIQREHDEMTVASELMKAHIKKNASFAQSQEAYILEAGRIEERYNAALEHYTALEAEKDKRNRKNKELETFIAMLKKHPLVVDEWDERLWITLLDTATVQRDGKIVFHFKSGAEITA